MTQQVGEVTEELLGFYWQNCKYYYSQVCHRLILAFDCWICGLMVVIK